MQKIGLVRCASKWDHSFIPLINKWNKLFTDCVHVSCVVQEQNELVSCQHLLPCRVMLMSLQCVQGLLSNITFIVLRLTSHHFLHSRSLYN